MTNPVSQIRQALRRRRYNREFIQAASEAKRQEREQRQSHPRDLLNAMRRQEQ